MFTEPMVEIEKRQKLTTDVTELLHTLVSNGLLGMLLIVLGSDPSPPCSSVQVGQFELTDNFGFILHLFKRFLFQRPKMPPYGIRRKNLPYSGQDIESLAKPVQLPHDGLVLWTLWLAAGESLGRD